MLIWYHRELNCRTLTLHFPPLQPPHLPAAPRRVKTEITSSTALLLDKLLTWIARDPQRITCNCILNQSTPRKVCLIFRTSPFLQPFHTFHQLNSWLENSDDKKKREWNCSHQNIFPYFLHICWRERKEEFLIQFISSPGQSMCLCMIFPYINERNLEYANQTTQHGR